MPAPSPAERALRVAVVGPARRRNGTGPFVARFLHGAGADVRAVVASTHASSRAAAAALAADLGRPVHGYGDVDGLIAAEPLDALAICTPAARHERDLLRALDAGLHAFCEKPLIWADGAPVAARSVEIADAFAARGLVLAVGEQWRFVLADADRLLGGRTREAATFAMRLAPPVRGAGMVAEAMSHPASVLACLGATGAASDVAVDWRSPEHAVWSGRLERQGREPLAAEITLTFRAEQPRPASMTFDGARVERVVSSLDPYRIGLRAPWGEVVAIADPVERCVREFVEDVATGRRADRGRLAATVRLLDTFSATLLADLVRPA